jgi:SP family xylose:H+ symportor-like MFS transporter
LALLFGLLFFLPETPGYLMLKNREENVRSVLSCLVTPQGMEGEMAEIHASLFEPHFGRLLSFGAAVVLIGIMLSVFQQFAGINVVLY